MNKHTPGPWSYWPECIGDGGRVTQDGTGQHIAAPTLYFKREQTEANARLIAAAPELLEVLQDLMECRDALLNNRELPMTTEDWETKCFAAITKATEGV